MKTLKDLIIEAKCRKGEAHGTTKRGAYWNCGTPAKIRSYGGDGIGNSGSSVTHCLELRHFRNGEVAAIVHVDAWHQNGSYAGAGDWWHDVSGILGSTTIEEVIVALKGERFDDTPAYSEWGKGNLVEALSKLGLPEAASAPDEE